MATSCAACVVTLPIHRQLSKLPTAPARLRCSVSVCDRRDTPSTVRLASLEATRRELAAYLLFSLWPASCLPALADVDGKSDVLLQYKQFVSDNDNYTLFLPSDWIKGTGKATGARLVTAFYPADDSSASVNVLITSVGADFASMGSFGTVDAFAERLVNSLDRSWKRPPGQAAKLVDSKLKKGLYYIEYTVQQPGEKKKHLLSVVGMRFNGWYNRLYTVTGQYLEDDKAKYGPVLEKVVDSFSFA